jgi:hypothetical protein
MYPHHSPYLLVYARSHIERSKDRQGLAYLVRDSAEQPSPHDETLIFSQYLPAPPPHLLRRLRAFPLVLPSARNPSLTSTTTPRTYRWNRAIEYALY